ncbi:glycosyltransferase [Sphingomonas sp. RP10(2022)]|uniref:sucrose-phosphate synthase n=1 Tax=Sphingomonas liriopis TaxID=2949094 RepID=A0A9X2I0A6_9SPHN|nr:HAD family hydrolase [Sphingomonas liriopis]MCP3736145.1 glycosyltransferase [Sphingomonas liriopis]
MFILHLALGGCLKAPPVDYGITADTGGHIAYILDAARAQGACAGVSHVSIVTRAFDDPRLGAAHGGPRERVDARVAIDRIATPCRAYLEKDALAAELPAFTEGFCAHLAALPRLPDVIHAHFADAAAVARVAQARFGIPFVYTPHALGIDKRAQGLGCDEGRIRAERAAIAGAAAIIVSTHDEAERQIGGYGVAVAGRIHCLPPGVPQRVDPDGAATLANRLGDWFDRPELPILLAVARPVAKKNLAALVRAYAGDAALQARANLVVLAGCHDHAAGEEREVLAELAALAADPALAARVALPPRHDAADVAALYDRAAQGGVFVNPALHEPFGLTLIEAAAAGVPVVATANGGPAEIVATLRHGMLVDPRDEGGIARACRDIVGDSRRHAALSAAGRARVGAYCWERYAAASVAVYRDAAAPRLLACDIDNTLTGCRAGAAAFAAWRSASPLGFVVATGRGIEAARAILSRWQLPEPDAFIVDVGTRLWLADDTGGWRECADYARTLDRDWDREAVARALAPLGVTPQPAETAGPHKLSFFGDDADAARIRATLAAAGLRARVIFSHGRLIDVLAPAGGKAAAIAAYAARAGWSLGQCIAAGDSGNDVDMLDACGHAIVVGNASDELADLCPRPGLHRVDAHHAAGVLEGLERLGLVPVALAEAA